MSCKVGGISEGQVAPIGKKDWEGVRSVAVDRDVGAGERGVWSMTVVWGEVFKELNVARRE